MLQNKLRDNKDWLMANEAVKSLDDIASLITTSGNADDQDAPYDGVDDDQLDLFEDQEQDDDIDDTSEIDEEDDVEDEADDEEDEGDEPEYLEIEDDTNIEVMVDGELETYTLAELKKLASGEGAIEKRLTEATETRKAAQAERTQWEQERQVQHDMLTGAFDAMHSLLFQSRVPEPDAALKQSNPQKYLLQKDDYDKEQVRLQNLQGQVQQLYGQLKGQIDENQKEYRRKQAGLLADALPILRDKEKGPQVQQEIVDAAQHYGFTPQEIKLAADHRLFKMAYDAAQWRKTQTRSKNAETTLEKAKKVRKKPPKTIRAGAVAKRKSAAQQQSKQRERLKNQAKKTGKVDDIAKLIVQ